MFTYHKFDVRYYNMFRYQKFDVGYCIVFTYQKFGVGYYIMFTYQKFDGKQTRTCATEMTMLETALSLESVYKS